MTLHRILVPTDFGPAATAALDAARDLAQLAGARLYLLHVVDDIAARFIDFPYAEIDDAQRSVEAAARTQLDQLRRRGDLRDLCDDAAVLTSTSAATAIAGYALDNHIDLIVMGTHGHGPVLRMFLGAVADRVVRTASCPVLTIREAARPHSPEVDAAAVVATM
jgi:nucleotide-binding universal stress UspA family protein